MTMVHQPLGRQERAADHTIDDLLLRLRGLVLVGRLLEQRGASAGEAEAPCARPNWCGRGLAG